MGIGHWCSVSFRLVRLKVFCIYVLVCENRKDVDVECMCVGRGVRETITVWRLFLFLSYRGLVER